MLGASYGSVKGAAIMRIAVFAAGAVGGYFGGKLAQSGEEVSFIARGDHLRAIREHGLRVESADGDFTLTLGPEHATDDPAAIGPVDVVLLAVKGWQMPDAIAAMRPLIGRETEVVPLLNGVEAAGEVTAAYGAEHAAGGLCGLFGSVVAPGHIRNSLPAPFVVIGELDNGPSQRLQRLADAWTHAGVRASLAPDIQAALWEKLTFVASLGGVGAVTRAPAGVLRALPETRDLLERSMREIVAVAQGRSVALEDAAVTRCLAQVDALPLQATTSMQRDIMAGRPSELSSQNGAIVRLGRAAGVATPVHAFIYSSLLPLEMQARGELRFSDSMQL
jgi:2-dehydropantoate 2-reductase